MVESVTTLTPVQPSMAVHKLDSDVDRLQVHEEHEAKNSSEDSGHKGQPHFSELEKKIKMALAAPNQSVRLQVDKETKKMVIKIVDEDTKEVVRQYPTAEMLKISRMVIGAFEQQGNITDARI